MRQALLSKGKRVVNTALHLVGLEINKATLPIMSINDSAKAQISSQFKHYHLGCGSLVVENFLNIDGELHGYTKKSGVPVEIKGANNCYVLRYDLRNGVPAEDNSLQLIYHSHFLEHLSNDQGRSFLEDNFRCLAPGGVLRFAVPDFELWCRSYMAEKSELLDWYKETYLDRYMAHQYFDTKAEIFGGMLFNWGHQMAYDFETIRVRLAAIGYTGIERCAWGISSSSHDFTSLESEASDRKPESLVVECRKP